MGPKTALPKKAAAILYDTDTTAARMFAIVRRSHDPCDRAHTFSVISAPLLMCAAIQSLRCARSLPTCPVYTCTYPAVCPLHLPVTDESHSAENPPRSSPAPCLIPLHAARSLIPTGARRISY
ncbi:hypothetical protein Bbelb_301320 [Branchiostoma belcheri]|nr:hypothetical protein Bbelb_301320 [Branchiostoma belcheri]